MAPNLSPSDVPPAPPPSAPVSSQVTAPPAQDPAQTEVIALPPELTAPPSLRGKPLKATTGIAPTASDLGSEADVVSSADDLTGVVPLIQTQKWTFSMKGYIRAPMRVSLGPRDDTATGNQLHSPIRMVGLSSSNWAYIAIAPNPDASLYATIGNPTVSGTLILTTNTFPEAGYKDLDTLGGISQGYVTLKFPDAFGARGGLALMMGSFSNRYGTAGPNQQSAGFYGTYLFGRTHVTGESITADIDLSDHVELLIEDGVGAKLEIIPFTGVSSKPMSIPGDPKVPLGSNFLHHAHVGLWVDNWLKIAAHYLTSWTPDDRAVTVNPSFGSVGEGRLSVVGADVHFDHERWGNGYIGFSHVWGHNLMPLDEALQVIHGARGYDFKLQYFGNKLRSTINPSNFLPNDGGRVETVLFQYILRSNSLLGYSVAHRGVSLAVYGMFSHAYSPPTGDMNSRPAPGYQGPFTVDDNKLKYGSLVEFAVLQYLSIGFRFDRVQPTSGDPEQTYTAVSPQLVLHSNWKSKEYIIVDYTHFFLRDHDYPDSPYSSVNRPADPNLFMVSAVMSL